MLSLSFWVSLSLTHAHTHSSPACHTVHFSATRVDTPQFLRSRGSRGRGESRVGKKWPVSQGESRGGGAESRGGWDDQWLGAQDSCRKSGILWLQVASALLVPLCVASLSWVGQRIRGEGLGFSPHTSPLCRGRGTGTGRAGQGGEGSRHGSALGLLRCLASLFSGVVGRPQGQVVSQQLHDEGAVFVGVLAEGVQVSHGLVEGGLGQ